MYIPARSSCVACMTVAGTPTSNKRWYARGQSTLNSLKNPSPLGIALLDINALSVDLNCDINFVHVSAYSDELKASLLYATSSDSVAFTIENKSASQLFDVL